MSGARSSHGKKHTELRREDPPMRNIVCKVEGDEDTALTQADLHVVFLGNARCFHTMDWFRSAQTLMAPSVVPFVTDLVESEGNVRLVRNDDAIIPLFNIDWLLFRKQSTLGNVWRNFVKAAVVPIQVLLLRHVARRLSKDGAILFHAHTMYYLWLCWLSGVKYVGTPQGSEVLVRPRRSRIYRYFAGKALGAAYRITVDSDAMRNGVRDLCGKDALVIQNGIDLSAIRSLACRQKMRRRIVSIRIIMELYRTKVILEARNRAGHADSITFVYPQYEEGYLRECQALMRMGDEDLARLPRSELYSLLLETYLVISIPSSDSSPRSVYEAIFCGCCVAVTWNPWIESLPLCMRARIFVVDLSDEEWFGKAVRFAQTEALSPYVPTEEALDMFDQVRSMKRVISKCYCA